VRYAGGLSAVQVEGSPEHVVLPEVLAQCRRRLDAPLVEARLTIQAARAMAAGRVSPAPRVVDTCPREPGSPRVHAAATL
jgi:hypothetical protein